MRTNLEIIARALYGQDKAFRTSTRLRRERTMKITEAVPFEEIAQWRHDRLLDSATAILSALSANGLIITSAR